MSNILEDDFQVQTREQSSELRARLARIADTVQRSLRRHPNHGDQFRSAYVTEHNRRDHQWFAVLPMDPPLKKQLPLYPHVHFVLPQDGRDPWFGINMEFKQPREFLLRALDPTEEWRQPFEDAVYQIDKGQVWVVRKFAREGNHYEYEWEHDWPGWPRTDTRAMTPDRVQALREELLIPPPASRREGWRLEPAIVIGWVLTKESAVSMTTDISLELARLGHRLADLLAVLLGPRT